MSMVVLVQTAVRFPSASRDLRKWWGRQEFKRGQGSCFLNLGGGLVSDCFYQLCVWLNIVNGISWVPLINVKMSQLHIHSGDVPQEGNDHNNTTVNQSQDSQWQKIWHCGKSAWQSSHDGERFILHPLLTLQFKIPFSLPHINLLFSSIHPIYCPFYICVPPLI